MNIDQVRKAVGPKAGLLFLALFEPISEDLLAVSSSPLVVANDFEDALQVIELYNLKKTQSEHLLYMAIRPQQGQLLGYRPYHTSVETQVDIAMGVDRYGNWFMQSKPNVLEGQYVTLPFVFKLQPFELQTEHLVYPGVEAGNLILYWTDIETRDALRYCMAANVYITRSVYYSEFSAAARHLVTEAIFTQEDK